MGQPAGTVSYQILADMSKLRTDLQKAEKRIKSSSDKMSRDFKRGAQKIQRSADDIGYAFNKLRRAAQVVASAFIFTAGIQRIGNLVLAIERAEEKMVLLNARMRVFARASDAFARAYNLSKQLHTSMEATADVMTRFLVASKEFGATQEQVEGLVEALTLMGRASGTSAEEMKGALRQASQGMASGRLQGEELRSVLENLPLYAYALADALGRPFGELRKLAAEGAITPEIMFRAAEMMDDRLRELPVTLSQATADMKTEWDLLLAHLGRKAEVNVVVNFISKKAQMLRVMTGDLSTATDEQLRERLIGLQREGNEARDRFYGLAEDRDWLQRLFGDPFSGLTLGSYEDDYYAIAQEILNRQIAAMERAKADAAKDVAQDIFVPLDPTARRKALEKWGALERKEMQSHFRWIENLEKEEIDKDRQRAAIRRELNNVIATDFDIFVAKMKVMRQALADEQITPEELEAYKQQLLDNMQSVNQEFKDDTEEMSEFAKQAARNIQDAFAEFLFDPFEDGLKGMLKSFIDTIRRMMAEMAAKEILGWIMGMGGGTKATGTAVGPPRAMGGPVSAGVAYPIGEMGPELFVPGSSGTIVPNHKLQGSGVTVVQNNNIDARGATQDVIQMLPGILAQNREAAVNDVRELVRRGGL